MSADRYGSDASIDDPTCAPEITWPRLRHSIRARGIRVREAIPPRVRRAGGTARQNPAPTASILASAGGVVAALIVRRRIAVTTFARARNRWVPAHFGR